MALLAVDANSVDALGDTAVCFGPFCEAEFYNYPVTEFDAAPVPEPSSTVLVLSSLALSFLWMRRRKAAQKGIARG